MKPIKKILSIIKKNKLLALIFTAISFIASVLTIESYFKTSSKEVALEQKKLKELIVHNTTNKHKFFYYKNPERGKGHGYPIAPNMHKTFILEGNYFRYQYYNIKNNYPLYSDTLGQGEIQMRVPTKKIILLK